MSKAPKQPVVLVLAGPNGAGKSTCAEGVLSEALKLPHFVNADTIARGLSAYRPETVAMQAGRLMIERLHDLQRQRSSFAFETTLSGRVYAGMLSEMKQQGYWIDLLYVCLPRPELCIERVAKRVSQGGHHVPSKDIHRRFSRSIDNLFNLYMPLANYWRIYDNSASAPRLIAYKSLDGATSVIDRTVFDDLKKRCKAT